MIDNPYINTRFIIDSSKGIEYCKLKISLRRFLIIGVKCVLLYLWVFKVDVLLIHRLNSTQTDWGFRRGSVLLQLPRLHLVRKRRFEKDICVLRTFVSFTWKTNFSHSKNTLCSKCVYLAKLLLGLDIVRSTVFEMYDTLESLSLLRVSNSPWNILQPETTPLYETSVFTLYGRGRATEFRY